MINLVNIDKDKNRASELTVKKDWNWAQNFLGENSDLAKQLAISTVPTYYLIGPEGLLTASTTDWEEMEKAISLLAPLK